MKEPLPKKVLTALRARMFEGTLPPGSRIDYSQVAVELGVSTTPVREAVAQLASEGIVELVPRFGAVVCSLDPTKASQFYEVREAVESFAAMKAAERLSPRHLELLQKHLGIMRDLYEGVLDRGEDSLTGPPFTIFSTPISPFTAPFCWPPRIRRSPARSMIATSSRVFYSLIGVNMISNVSRWRANSMPRFWKPSNDATPGPPRKRCGFTFSLRCNSRSTT